jgi:hypothetical protein
MSPAIASLPAAPIKTPAARTAERAIREIEGMMKLSEQGW